MPTKGSTQDVSLLREAREKAERIARSNAYVDFVNICQKELPLVFKLDSAVIDRDHLRVVDHHLKHLTPRISPYITSKVRRVLDFGCGSGGSAIALAMVHPEIH